MTFPQNSNFFWKLRKQQVTIKNRMISPFQLCFFAISASISSYLGLKTIYVPRPFQRVQICEDRSLGTGDMSEQGVCLKVKNIHL
jgi:hypothetical protein